MNAAHRIADGFRAVVSYWTPTPTASQFIEKGTLTPQEFVEAGDQLAFKFPTWKWQSADSRRRVSWLPPNKQYLITYGVSCRSRVRDLDASLAQSTAVSLGPDLLQSSTWYLPHYPSEDNPDQTIPDVVCSSSASKEPPLSRPDVVNFDDIDNILHNDDDIAAVDDTTTDEDVFVVNGKGHDLSITRTRSYDLSVTYDKYYQTPRLWLKGYDEQGLPLDAQQIFEDILTDYISKTVTIDPHPCTGELTVSIHPCKHAAMMKKVIDGWITHGITPRHDLALIVLLKFISSVIPTIHYDTTLDIAGFSTPGSFNMHQQGKS